ncbi:MAG: TetR/AcrR family transcriptional regulator [Bacteroidales bacterium]
MIEDKDAVREQIINSASVIFGRYGYKKTTMDEIGMAFGKGKTAIYYYFKNKEDVFKAVVEREAAQLEKSLFEAVTDKATPEEKLKSYFYARMRTMLNLSNFYDAMKNEVLDHLPFINKIRKDVDQKEMALVKTILEEGVNRGHFEIKDLEMASQTLVTAIKGLEIPLFVENKINNMSLYIDHLIHIICYGLIKR